MRSQYLSILFFVAILLAVHTPCMGSVIHVPTDHPTIQQAIDAASNGDIIEVAPGTYVERIDFIGKAIHVRSSHGAEMTVIDGDQGGSVVTFESGEGHDSILESFTITNGKVWWKSGERSSRSDESGAGIHCDTASPMILQNIIFDNHAFFGGGGIYCRHSEAIIRQNDIYGNTATMLGVGLYIVESEATIDGNFIHDNVESYAEAGGGIYCEGSPGPRIVNNMICNNDGGFEGGGIGSYLGDMTVVNNTIVDNTASMSGGGILCNPNSQVTIANTIVRDNHSLPGGEEIAIWVPGTLEVSHCNVRNGWPGINNLDADPLFQDAANRDYHLTFESPCINRGLNDAAPARDFDRDPRILHGTVDIGADEYAGTPSLNADLFTLSEATGGTVNFYLFGGAPNGGRDYLLLGSASGTVPGWPLPGGSTLPLNPDVFTDFVLALLNTQVFQSFKGTLTWGSSSGWAMLDTLGPLPPGTAGLTLHFAYCLYKPFDFASNPVVLEIVP